MMTDNKGLGYRLSIILVSVLAISLFTVAYVGHAIHENNRPFCAVIVTITKPRPQPPVDPNASPPATSSDAKYAARLNQYRLDVAKYNADVARELTNLSHKYRCK